MDAYEYYQFRNTVTTEEIVPGIYKFCGCLDGDIVLGIYNLLLNSFIFTTGPVGDKNILEIKKLLKEKILEERK